MLEENTPGNVTFLVVEDDDIDVEALRRLLKKMDCTHRIVRARNGAEGLEVLRGENSSVSLQYPYIILLDINMPMMSGIDMLEEMRRDSNLHDDIVFILTTSPRQKDKLKAYQLNAAGYFLKENLKDFVSLITQYSRMNHFEQH